MRKRIVLWLAFCCLLLSGCGKQEKQEAPKEPCWQVTQYGMREGNPSMFYSIADGAGGLILVDGGYESDAELVRQIIAQHGNRVLAWIITHPHPDHAGAFNAIMENPGELVVEKIYTIAVHEERYLETAEEYDQVPVYEKFRDLTSNMDQVVYVQENQEWETLGLSFRVLHAWDEETDEFDSNLCNKGSMVFTMKGKRDKMLFCADLESEAQDSILERHREALVSDYVQLGHHGNWGPSIEFYEGYTPRAVFFDAADWLVDMEKNIYDAYELKAYFQQKGVTIYTFGTAPNTISFY